jgi:hypothetical protein
VAPEPLVGPADEVAASAELADSLLLAFLVVLETLSPVERTVFRLREAFDFGYDEIATIVGRSEANRRQSRPRGAPRRGATAASTPGRARRASEPSVRRSNGRPGLRTTDAEGRTVSVMALHVEDGQIAAIHSVVNPEKLRHLGRPGTCGLPAPGPSAPPPRGLPAAHDSRPRRPAVQPGRWSRPRAIMPSRGAPRLEPRLGRAPPP